nr:MAG TPA: antirepressor [Bacteriophage sp.]
MALTPIIKNNQTWLSSSELAKALGYSQENAVAKIYNRNADEFSEKMTTIIKNPQLPNLGMRIFSLRGCHLIAMFARTAIAKKFRIWVLDILDRETKSTSYDRTPLRQACDRLAVGNMLISDAYRFVADRYQVDHIDQIPLDKLAEATGYVYQLILQLQPTTPATNTANLKGLVTHACITTAWFNAVKQPLAMLNPNLTREISSVFAWNVTNAKLINHEYGLGVDVDNLLSANWQARIKGE